MTYISDKDAAKIIRQELKAAFPGIKFWVTSKNGINVSWIDGPTAKAVELIANRFQNIRRDQATGDILSGGNRYVFVNRLYSEDALTLGLSKIQAKNHTVWSKVDFTAVTFKPNYDQRGSQLVNQPEYTSCDYGYRVDLSDEIIKELKDVDFTAQEVENIEPCETVETEILKTVEAVETEIVDEATQEILDVRAERYNQRKERRIERYDALAKKHEKEHRQTYEQARSMASVIPFGQPILIGHHSETRDRNYRSKIQKKFAKSFEHKDKSEYYAQKSQTAKNNHSISSDDPEAIAKIKKEIAELESLQTTMKEANKIVRSKKLSKDEKIQELNTMGLDGQTLMNPKWHYSEGFQGFELSNNNANINRLKKRLTQLEHDLEKAATLGDTEQHHPEHELTVIQARSINRLQLKFNGKPNEHIRSSLKSNGFRWAPSEGAWQRHLGNSAYALNCVMTQLETLTVSASV